MPKQCSRGDCANPVFGGGMCRYHQGYRTDKNPKPLKRNSIKRNVKRIKPASDGRIHHLTIYRPKRDKYLREHPVCEVHDCHNKTTNLHHKRGREHNIFFDDWARDNDIPLLHDVRFFMGCCGECHPKRMMLNPKWARKMGYIL